MAFSKAYKDFEEKLYSMTDSMLKKQENVEMLFSELLSVLPNNGKLYKYKALDTFHIDELEEKYVWFSSAAKLNDKKDCTFNASAVEQMGEIAALYHGYIHDENSFYDFMDMFFAQIKEVRNSMQVLSLTTSYKKDSMWAYYCNNKGICIEYDFTKVKTLKEKFFFAQMQKVKYGQKKKYNFVDTIKLKSSRKEYSIQLADRMIIEQLLTKDESWKMEDEWRVVMNDEGNYDGKRLETDIVSAIYLDFSIMQEEKAKRIVEIAKTNGWGIYIRWFDEYEAEYRYITLDCYQAILKQMKNEAK